MTLTCQPSSIFFKLPTITRPIGSGYDLGVDESTGFIHAQVLTGNGEGDGDAQQVPELLDQVKNPIDRVGGDDAYDTYEIWDELKQRDIEGIIPPQENAIYWVDECDLAWYCSKERYWSNSSSF